MAGPLFDARSIQNDLAGEASQGLLDGSVVVPLPPVSVHNVVLKTPKIGARHLNSLSLSLSHNLLKNGPVPYFSLSFSFTQKSKNMTPLLYFSLSLSLSLKTP